MKRTLKRVGIALGIILVLIILFAGFMLFTFQKETSLMTPSETGELVPGVYAVKDDFVNFFLLETGDGLIAVDAGNDPEVARAEMNKLGLDPGDVKAVLLTHADSDHTAAIPIFKNAKVYMNELEEQMIDGRTNRFLIVGNKLETPYHLLKDRQAVTFGNLTVRCIATPGHTPGSMSYLVNNHYLFVGDSASLRFKTKQTPETMSDIEEDREDPTSLKKGRIALFNDAFNMDNETQRKSLEMLAELKGVTHVFTAHYGYTDDFESAFAEFW